MRKEWFLSSFQQLRSYRYEMKTLKREEIPYSQQDSRGLLVAEEP